MKLEDAKELGREYQHKIETFVLSQGELAKVTLKKNYISLVQMETSFYASDKEELRTKLEIACKFDDDEYESIIAKIEELNNIKFNAMDRLMKGELKK